jgi:hypothetical protein
MFNLKISSWWKKPVAVEAGPVPKSFVIPNDHKLLRLDMDIDDENDLVDINAKPLSYAEAALMNVDKPTTTISMKKSHCPPPQKPVNHQPLQDSLEFYPVKINHHQKNKELKKKYRKS